MRTTAIVIGLLLLALGAFVGAARLGALDTDPAEAMRRYGGPPSQFAEIDGTRVHYRDEGRGPVLVLLHGSRASLHQWDGWLERLRDRFRIVRIDAPAHGLSGADGRDDYGADREIVLLDALLDRLGVERCVMVGTSSGSTTAIRYAAAHPTRVEKLVLSTVPLRLPAQARTSRLDRLIFGFHDDVLGTTSTTLFWRRFLESIFGDPGKVTPEMVERLRVLNGLPGQQQRFVRRLARWRQDGGPERDRALAAQVRVPTLIQWGGAGPVLPRELHCAISAAFSGTDVRVIRYPEPGHQLVLEDPERTSRDAVAFILEGTGGERCTDAAPDQTRQRTAS